MPGYAPQEDFHQRLKVTRQDRGWTIRELAKRAGVRENRITWLEHGRAYPTAEQARRLAWALGVSLDWLLALDDLSAPSPQVTVVSAVAKTV
jgi:transcriptional regulator with XRE-family HTH domain